MFTSICLSLAPNKLHLCLSIFRGRYKLFSSLFLNRRKREAVFGHFLGLDQEVCAVFGPLFRSYQAVLVLADISVGVRPLYPLHAGRFSAREVV